MNDMQDQPVEMYYPSASQPKRGIEWRAVAYGCFVGLFLLISQNMLLGILWRALFENAANQSYNTAAQNWYIRWLPYGILQIGSLAISVVIGAVAAYYAHYQPYRTALIARIIVFLANMVYLWFRAYHYSGWSFLFRWTLWFNLMLCLAGACFGASLALSFKRNRGVRVN